MFDKIKTMFMSDRCNVIKAIFGLYLVTMILFSPLVNKIPYGHDIYFHFTNIQMFIEKINGGFDIFSYRIFGNVVARGFGYGAFIFYPCLSYAITSIMAKFIEMFGVLPEFAIPNTFMLISFLSSITMFFFAKRIYKDNKIAFLCATSYVSSVYFLCDVYVRCALAETLIFIFIPMIFSSLYELFNGSKYKFYFLFILGYTGMINSHLVMTLYLTIFIIILFLCNFKRVFKLDIIKRLIIATVMSLLISSPYLVPLIEHKIIGNYVVFKDMTMYSFNGLNYHSMKLYDYFYIGKKVDDGIQVYFNYITLILFVIVIIYNKTIFKNKDKKIYINLLILFFASAFMASAFFPWVKMPNILRDIQFPWRLCSFMVFAMAALAGGALKLLNGDKKKCFFAIGLVLTISFGLNSIRNMDEFVTELVVNEYNLGSQNEYMPVNTVNDLAYYYSRSNDIVILSGEADTKILENNSPYLIAQVKLDSDNVKLELPRFYYLGYNISLIDKNNKTKKIDYYEDDNGFIAIDLKDSGKLIVEYTGTLLDRIFYFVSPLSLIVFLILLVIDLKKSRKKI